jgi:hypothetical protein
MTNGLDLRIVTEWSIHIENNDLYQKLIALANADPSRQRVRKNLTVTGKVCCLAAWCPSFCCGMRKQSRTDYDLAMQILEKVTPFIPEDLKSTHKKAQIVVGQMAKNLPNDDMEGGPLWAVNIGRQPHVSFDHKDTPTPPKLKGVPHSSSTPKGSHTSEKEVSLPGALPPV